MRLEVTSGEHRYSRFSRRPQLLVFGSQDSCGLAATLKVEFRRGLPLESSFASGPLSARYQHCCKSICYRARCRMDLASGITFPIWPSTKLLAFCYWSARSWRGSELEYMSEAPSRAVGILGRRRGSLSGAPRIYEHYHTAVQSHDGAPLSACVCHACPTLVDWTGGQWA